MPATWQRRAAVVSPALVADWSQSTIRSVPDQFSSDSQNFVEERGKGPKGEGPGPGPGGGYPQAIGKRRERRGLVPC